MPLSLQEGIRTNRLKTYILVFSLPLILAIAIFLVSYYDASKTGISNDAVVNEATANTIALLSIGIPLLLIWLVIAFNYEKKIMFSFSGAKEVTRREEPEIYNIVENLCITRGLPTPKIGIIEEEGMNAFALGRRAKDSRICFTRGLLNNLNRKEIEAVAGHELTHIINKDSMLMLVTILYIGAIAVAGRYIYFRGGNERRNNIGLVLILLGYAFYPLIRLAISRKREYLADAGSVLLTHDNQAMISALRKISQKPKVSLKNDSIASLFIENPLSGISTLFQTHPSIEDRIKALEHY